MAPQLRHYNNEKMFSPDFHKVRDFLVEMNRHEYNCLDFEWDRWEWIFSLPHMDQNRLETIGLWEEQGQLVAMVTYEEWPGGAYVIVSPGYEYLKPEMLAYAEMNLSHEGSLKVNILNTDGMFQKIAQKRGYRPTQDKEPNSLFDIADERLAYTLPEGFRIISFDREYDWKKYHRVLWNGFNHEGEPPETEKEKRQRETSLSGPHSDLSLKIAVVAPDGNYASFCGMWYEPGTRCCYVEPVATDPAYRRMGCGRAAVLEGIKRCANRGAREAYVGSDQTFYYNIGFRPLPAYTFWEKKL